MQRWKLWALTVAGMTAIFLITVLDAREQSSETRPAAPLAPPAPPATGSARDRGAKAVAFIMDTSGSMDQPLEGKRRIDCAKDSLLRILDLYRAHDEEFHDLDAGLWCF